MPRINDNALPTASLTHKEGQSVPCVIGLSAEQRPGVEDRLRRKWIIVGVRPAKCLQWRARGVEASALGRMSHSRRRREIRR
jgi:hypothetical protein